MRHGCLVHSVEIAYNRVFFRIELDVIKKFTEDDKVTTWYQANISPKACIISNVTYNKIKLLARLPNFQNPNCNPFFRIFFKKAEFRTYFVCYHTFSYKIQIPTNSHRAWAACVCVLFFVKSWEINCTMKKVHQISFIWLVTPSTVFET